jgi:thymidylate synthase
MYKGEHDNIYLNLIKDVLNNGTLRNDRTGTGTLSVFGRQLRFDLTQGIPILTTKRIPWKTCIKELLWFLRGETNTNILKSQGVHIWNKNSTRQYLNSKNLNNYPEGEIGPGYGFQWRNFGGIYDPYASQHINGTGIDQLNYIIQEIKQNPFSRRLYMTAWNPFQIKQMALPPCHVSAQFYIEEDEKKQKWISCHMYQRSVDCFLGLPFNILSYSVLTHIIANMTGDDIRPKNLIISTGDTHLYTNHIQQINTQLLRSPFDYPELLVNPLIKNKKLEEITINDFLIIDYHSHDSIFAELSA